MEEKMWYLNALGIDFFHFPVIILVEKEIIRRRNASHFQMPFHKTSAIKNTLIVAAQSN